MQATRAELCCSQSTGRHGDVGVPSLAPYIGAEGWSGMMTQFLHTDNSFAVQNRQRSAITGRGGRFLSLVPDMGGER